MSDSADLFCKSGTALFTLSEHVIYFIPALQPQFSCLALNAVDIWCAYCEVGESEEGLCSDGRGVKMHCALVLYV